MIERIRGVYNSMVGRPVTIGRILSKIRTEADDGMSPSWWQVRNIIKHDLQMSYRKMSIRTTSVESPEQLTARLNAGLQILNLLSEGAELVFIDEFKFD